MLDQITDEADLLVLREEPLDTAEDIFGPSFFIILRNFDLNSNALKPLHRQVLQDRVLNYVKRNVGFAEIYAMTDRSGSHDVNYRVAGARLSEVQQFLMAVGAPSLKVMHPFAKAIGEDFFEDRFDREHDPTFRDSVKNSKFRSVIIALTPAPIGVPTKIFRALWIANTIIFCRRHQQRR
jgi:hypothetical protein